VPVIEHVPLARALAATTKAGLYIPPELFEPVAQILRIAMNLEYDTDEESAAESA
jgi:type III secretion protein U